MAKTKEVRELMPRDAHAKHIGPEPKFDNAVTAPDWDLAKAYSWYNYYFDKKDAREFIASYLDHTNQPVLAKTVRRVSESSIKPTYGWLARCFLRGAKVEESISARFNAEVDRLVATVEDKQPSATQIVSNRPNVQEIMRERTLEVGGELEGQWDNYLKNGAKKESDIKVVDILTQNNILPQHVSTLIAAWQNKLNEYNEVVTGDNDQLNEAYDRFGKIQLRNIVSTIETVIADLNAYIGIKKAGKKPRKKKPVSVEKVVRRLKYLKTFKLEKLELESVSPTKLHGCSEAWVYDTKKRKLHHYVADEYTKTLGVKGNTVVGFCTKESQVKNLRKPEVQIKEIMGSKPQARRFFNSIKAVASTPKGRFNNNMIILRAF